MLVKDGCVEEYFVGGSRTCARLRDGSYRCRGWNRDNQSTHGNWPGLPKPTEYFAAFPGGWDELYLGASQTIARKDGKVFAWGKNYRGQLADPAPSTIDTPMQMALLPEKSKKVGGWEVVCTLTEQDQLWCQDRPNHVIHYRGVPDGVLGFHAWDRGACAFSATEVRCRASDAYLNAGPDADRSSTKTTFRWGPDELLPIEGLPKDDPFVQLTGTCVLTRSGAVWCWGPAKGLDIYPMGTWKRCESGCPGSDFRRAQKATTLPAMSAIVNHAGLSRSGEIFVWSPGFISLASEELERPQKISEFGNQNIAVGAGVHVCALRTDGTLWCAGDNRHREVADEVCPDQICPVTRVRFECD